MFGLSFCVLSSFSVRLRETLQLRSSLKSVLLIRVNLWKSVVILAAQQPEIPG